MFWTLILPRHSATSGRSTNKLLVVKLDAIGDFLLFLDTMQRLRKILPASRWEISLLGNRIWSDLAVALEVADYYRFVDVRFFEINPIYRLRTLSWVKSAGFDVVLQGVYSRSFYRDDSIVRVSNAPQRIGYRGDTYNSPFPWMVRGNRYYTDLIASPQAVSSHMLEQHACLLTSLGGDGSVSLPFLPSIKDFSACSAFWIDRPYFVMVPGGSARIRQWPCERFSRLAEYIHSRTGCHPVILGGEKDRAVASEVISNASSLHWINLCGKTSLLDALEVIRNARCYVGNDTGLTHMATMARVPTLALVGGAFPGRDFPYPAGVASHVYTAATLPPCKGCGWRCNALIDGRAKCILDITLDAAISRMQWL